MVNSGHLRYIEIEDNRGGSTQAEINLWVKSHGKLIQENECEGLQSDNGEVRDFKVNGTNLNLYDLASTK